MRYTQTLVEYCPSSRTAIQDQFLGFDLITRHNPFSNVSHCLYELSLHGQWWAHSPVNYTCFKRLLILAQSIFYKPSRRIQVQFPVSIWIKEELLQIQVTNTKMFLDFGYMLLSMTLMTDFEFDFSRRRCRNQYSSL